MLWYLCLVSEVSRLQVMQEGLTLMVLCRDVIVTWPSHPDGEGMDRLQHELHGLEACMGISFIRKACASGVGDPLRGAVLVRRPLLQ